MPRLPGLPAAPSGRLRAFAALGALVASVAVPAPAEASFGLLVRPAGSAKVTEARLALSRGPTRSTLWAQARVEGAADALLWVVPVPGGAAVDVSSGGWLDALEEATAPRVRPPLGSPPSGLSCEVPKDCDVTTSGDAEAPVFPSATSLAGSIEQVKTQAEAWGFDPASIDAASLTQAAGEGGRWLLLRLAPPEGASATPALRIHGPAVGPLSLSLLEADATSPLSLSTWLIGDGRGRAEGLKEGEVAPDLIKWSSPSSTTYAQEREKALTAGAGKLLLVEASGAAPLRSPTVLPGVGSTIPAAVDAYLVRASTRADEPFDLGPATSQVHAVLSPQAVFGEACPRGDLAAAQGWSCDAGAETGSEALAPTPSADDLRFAFAGPVSTRWVTRLVGVIPAGTKGRSFSALWGGSEGVSVVKAPSPSWAQLCQVGGSSGSSGAGSATGAGGAPGVPPGGGGGTPKPVGGQGGVSSGGDPDEAVSSSSAVDVQSQTTVDVHCSGDSSQSSGDTCGGGTDKGSGDDSCGGDSEGSSHDDGCGCGDSGGDSADDSCGGGSSGGDSCGSSSGGGESCSGGGGESCSGGSNSCSVSKGAGPKRSKLSRISLLVSALALPLRRWARRRRGGGR